MGRGNRLGAVGSELPAGAVAKGSLQEAGGSGQLSWAAAGIFVANSQEGTVEVSSYMCGRGEGLTRSRGQ